MLLLLGDRKLQFQGHIQVVCLRVAGVGAGPEGRECGDCLSQGQVDAERDVLEAAFPHCSCPPPSLNRH